MPRYTFIQNSFNSGEIDEKLHARTDLKEYKSGLKELTNMLPYKGGGARTRPALRHVRSETRTGQDRTFAFSVPFVFSKEDSYTIEFLLGAEGPAFYFGQIKVKNSAGTDETVSVDIPLLISGTGIYEDNNIYGWSYAQTGDVLIMTHSSSTIKPVVVYRLGDPGSYTFYFSFLTDGHSGVGIPDIIQEQPHLRLPYGDANKDSTLTMSTSTATPGATGTLTCSSPFFESGHVGSYILIEDGAASPPITSIILEITAVGASPSATATVYVHSVGGAFPTATAKSWWYLSAWSNKNGWPRTVCIHENRLIFAGSKTAPDTVWASEQYYFGFFNRYVERSGPGQFTYQRTPGGAEEPFQFSLSSNTVDSINWMISGKTLHMGTLSKEYLISGGSDSALSRLNISALPQSYYGGSPYPAANSNSKSYFISKDGKSVIEVGFSEENGSYATRNLSTLSDGIIFKNQTDRSARFVSIVWHNSASTLWCLTNDGRLFSCTIDSSAGVVAWAKHPASGLTVVSMYVKPTANGDQDEFFIMGYHANLVDTKAVVTLKICGDFELDTLFNASTREEDEPIYMDFGVKLNEVTATTTFTAPAVLEGLTGTVLADDGTADGLLIPNITVGSGGIITLPTVYNDIIFGIPYDHNIHMLTPEIGPNDILASQGDILRIDRATVFYYKTWYSKCGAQESVYPSELPSVPYTGKLKVDIPATADNENSVIIESSSPLPMAVLGVVLRGVNNS